MSRVIMWLAAAALAVAVSGCATYPATYYYPGGAGEYAAEPYDDGRGDYYYGERDYYGGYGYGSSWPYYYSVLYPSYSSWYDPWWSPSYYYGITYFPSTWFGIGIGYWDAWPYYHAYAPYRYSFWDSYYDWYGGYGGYGHHHDYDSQGGPNWRENYRDHAGYGRYGSARNEAERIAHLMGADRYETGAKSSDRRAPTTGDWRDSARSSAMALSSRSHGAPDWRGRSGGSSAVVPTYASQVAPAAGGGARGQAERWQQGTPSQPMESTTYAPRSRAGGGASGERYVYPRQSAGSAGNGEWVAPMPARGQPYGRRAPTDGGGAGASNYQSAPGPGYESAPAPRYERPRGQSGDDSARVPRYDTAPALRWQGPRGQSGYESAPTPRYDAAPAPRWENPRGQSGYGSAPAPRYDAAPAARYDAAPAPRYESAPAPRYAAPAPRYDAPRGDSGGRGGSDRSDGGSARGERGGGRDQSHED